MKPAILLLLISSALAAQELEGNVFDSLTGAPISGALVKAVGSGNQTTVSRTDAAGHFRVAAEAFSMGVSRAGYLPVNRSAFKRQAAAQLRINLTPAAVIAGKLTDEDGLPVHNAMVLALRYQMVNGVRKLENAPVIPTQTDDLGAYRIFGLPAGRYYIRANTGDLANWDSRYTAEYFPGTLQPTADGLIEVKPGEERGGIDLRLTKQEGVTVEGRVVLADGVPAPQTMPHVYLQPEGFGMGNYHGFRQSRDGTFRIAHVPPGSYTLRTMFGGAEPTDLLTEQRLEVGSADLRNVVFTLRQLKPMDVAGTVLLEGGGAAGPEVIQAQTRTGQGATATSNEEGTFTLKGLKPGHYELQAFPADAMKYVTNPEAYPPGTMSRAISARFGDQEVLDSGFDLDAEPAESLKITLGTRKYNVAGKLMDPAGKPVGDGLVWMDSGQPGGTALTVTDAEGAFHLWPRSSGKYRIYAIGDQSQTDSMNDPDYVQAHEKDFPPVMVVEGENPPLILHLPQARP